jgi:phospholipid-translocating ATPase
MGILMRHTETKRLIFYLKGADTALIPKISEVQTGFVMDECENLATEGLRTLVIT